MVESQYIAATMKLVDSVHEQDMLEALIEQSKPALPDDTAGLDYLLATPFRYYPKRGGSRFRDIGDPGVFYAAQSVRTASAELGYWRWKFLQDAVDLERLDPVAHTAFQVEVHAQVVDLRLSPFVRDSVYWQDPNDYEGTQSFARVARQAGVGGILYRSVRDVKPSWCLALLTPSGFAKRKPNLGRQTWYLTVSRLQVVCRCEAGESFEFDATQWSRDGGR